MLLHEIKLRRDPPRKQEAGSPFGSAMLIAAKRSVRSLFSEKETTRAENKSRHVCDSFSRLWSFFVKFRLHSANTLSIDVQIVKR